MSDSGSDFAQVATASAVADYQSWKAKLGLRPGEAAPPVSEGVPSAT